MSDHSSGDGGFDKYSHRRSFKSNYKPTSDSPTTCLANTSASPIVLKRKEIDSLNFISSPQKVFQIISSFDERKREMVESIGFGGILKLPSIISENKNFSYWLLYHMRWFNASIDFGDKIRLPLNEQHIGKITGLNSLGNDIGDTRLRTVQEKLAFMGERIPFLGSNNGVLAQAEIFVKQDLPSVLSKQDIDNFKTAFVIFIIGRFLAPSTEHQDGNTNFWGALKYPDEISSYNWCSYVLMTLKASARLVNLAKTNNKPLSTVFGCTLILQVFYLDNIDFGELNLTHDLFPRWNAYSDEYINAMVSADTIGIPTAFTSPQFGKNQVTRVGSTCYIFNQKTSNHTPGGSSPSPRLRPIGRRRSSFEISALQGFSDDDISGPNAFDLYANDSASPVRNYESNLADFNSLISNKYSGQVDPKILDEFKKYHSRCLNIFSASHRALVASISNENAQFAMSLIELYNKRGNSGNALQPYTHLPPTRRQKIDLYGATDSSTDGEDNNSLSKLPTINFPSIDIPSNSNPGAATYSKEHRRPDVIAGHLNTNSPLLPSRPNSELQSISIPFRQPNEISDERIHDCSVFQETFKPNSSSDFKSKGFVTPLATLKMPPIAGVLPIKQNKHFCVPSLSVKMLDEINEFDINSVTFDDECNLLSGPKIKASPGPFCASHFFLRLQQTQSDSNHMKEFYRWISDTNGPEFDSNWIILSNPRVLTISGQELKDHFVLNKTMNFDVFDISIRRIKELDSVIYQPVHPLRWRHLTDSLYARIVLGSENISEKKALLQNFLGYWSDYEVSRCQLFFVPVFLDGAWVCYAWDLQASLVHVVDPSATTSKDELIINKHIGAIHQLSVALSTTISENFNGWVPNFTNPKFSVVRIHGMPYSRKVSGLITLFCIWNFDGNTVTAHANLENIAKFKAFMLSQILLVRDNAGTLPSFFNLKNQ